MPLCNHSIFKTVRATTTDAPQARTAGEPVAKLIDISKCIGCKACQVACMQWNDLRDDIGTTVGVYDNPIDLTDQSWTVMRFAEVTAPDGPMAGQMEWLIRKDGCMHCEDPGCLKACPAPGAIVKYANGIVDFISENCIGCGYCIAGCPFDIPRISKKDNKAYKCSLCSDRVAVGLAPACVKTCPTGALQFGAKVDMIVRGEKTRASIYRNVAFSRRALQPAGSRWHARDVRAAARRSSTAVQQSTADPTISPWVSLWKGIAKPLMALALGVAALGAFFHYVTRGPKEVDESADAADRSHRHTSR